MRARGKRRIFNSFVALCVLAGLMAINGPTVMSAGKNALEDRKINSMDYKQRAGHWSVLPVPERFRVNALHAAQLRTGKVLIIVGSGNQQKQFDAGKFKTLLWDPATNKFKLVHTPSDMFCAGHTFLPDGKLLIGGGTTRYEKLDGQVKRAAGVVALKNESPDGGPKIVERDTRIVAPDGTAFRTVKDAVVEPATKTVAAGGRTTVTAGATEVWVEALERGRGSVIDQPTKYTIEGTKPSQSDDFYGFSQALTLAKQDYWGDDKSYVFDPATERYTRVGDMTLARWYPTLVGLEDGKVLSVSGLDEFGRMIDGHNEVFDPKTKTWTAQEQLKRTFPTYPSLFLMPGGDLFYTGSNAGYGSDKIGRDPGIWDLDDNSFKKVPGMRDPDMLETSGSVLLPPAQDQRVMVAGGGGIGESKKSTARTDIIDLRKDKPRFTPGPDLAEPVRYPNMVITPNDKVVITGGSRGYRGRGKSDVLVCQLYDPKSGRMKRMADPTVGRNYHAGALLLPDGRIITLGSEPLYRDAAGKLPGRFEKRIEIYSPPYLFKGDRPQVTSGPQQVRRGQTVRFGTTDATSVKSARLVRPSAVTHVTDVDQRSVALDGTKGSAGIEVKIPKSAGLLPSGWYMLFVTGKDGAPSKARWVQVL